MALKTFPPSHGDTTVSISFLTQGGIFVFMSCVHLGRVPMFKIVENSDLLKLVETQTS